MNLKTGKRDSIKVPSQLPTSDVASEAATTQLESRVPEAKEEVLSEDAKPPTIANLKKPKSKFPSH